MYLCFFFSTGEVLENNCTVDNKLLYITHLEAENVLN